MPSISKTKSGERYRAPTDQARKQDRKKENKRNKKDRQQIRQAMAKFCNLDETTSKLLALERQILGLDPQPFHIDVLRKKQKVLQDSINKRRLTLQQGKEEAELKKFNDKMTAYQNDCAKLAILAHQERLAREADPDMIPLPMGEASMMPAGPGHAPYMAPPPVKRKVEFQLPPRPARASQKPPGPPCGLAPTFSDSEDDNDDGEDQYDDGDLAPVPIPEFDTPYPPPMHRNYGGPPSSYHNQHMPPPRMPNYHPHSHYNPMGFQQPHHTVHHQESAIISSAPQINNRKDGSAAPATLSAAPELRNLRRETVKLVPAQLLRRPGDNRSTVVQQHHVPIVPKKRPEAQKQAKNTDEAYNDFMKELDGLI
ncbi:unnamed protein product [Caenorhabditis nigoni]